MTTSPDPRTPERPPRPLLAASIAVVAGSVAGLVAAPGLGLGPRAVVGLFALGAGAAAGWTAARDRGAASGAEVRGPTPMPRGLPPIMGLALFFAAAWRAGDAPPHGDRDSHPAARWMPIRSSDGDTRGRLGRETLVLPDRAAGAGEWLVVAGREDQVARKRGAEDVRRVAASRSAIRSSFGSLASRVRAALLDRLRALDRHSDRVLCAALLFGDPPARGEALNELFVRTGTRHLLAVSGLHVAIATLVLFLPAARVACGAIVFLFRAIGRAPPRCVTAERVTCLLLAAYVPLAGGGTPVVRSALAAGLALLAVGTPARDHRPGSARRPDGPTLLGAALALECLADPHLLRSLSLQLSYSATAGLLFAARPAANLLPRLAISGVDAGGRPRASAWVRPLDRGILLARDGLGASIAASLATLPLMWTYFGEWSFVGLVATPAALLLVAAAMIAGTLFIIFPLPATEVLLSAPLSGLVTLLEWADRLPATPAPLPPRPLWLVALACATALVAIRRGRWSLARISALLACPLLVPWTRAPAGLTVEALDMGHGTSVLIRAPGEACWVFDGGSLGSADGGRRVLLDALAAREVGELVVVLSHAHRDHWSALPPLLERYRPRRFLGALPAPVHERLPHGVPRADAAPGRLVVEGGNEGGVRWTLIRSLAREGNEGSRSLLVEWEGQSVLLCGDAEGAGLAASLEQRALGGPHRLLLLPHHGSETPHLGALLEASRPAEVWVAGRSARGVRAEMERRGIPLVCTGEDGPAMLRIHRSESRQPARIVRVEPPAR